MDSYVLRSQGQDDAKRPAQRCITAVEAASRLAAGRGWLAKDPVFDDLVQQRFLRLTLQAVAGELDSWSAEPGGSAQLLMLNSIPQATPIATTPSQHLPQSFFARPAEVVATELIGCLLVKRQRSNELLWGVIVETEAYSQDDPACHGYRRRSPQNETLFGEPGRFYVYVSYGIHHCVNVVTGEVDRPLLAIDAEPLLISDAASAIDDSGHRRTTAKSMASIVKKVCVIFFLLPCRLTCDQADRIAVH